MNRPDPLKTMTDIEFSHWKQVDEYFRYLESKIIKLEKELEMGSYEAFTRGYSCGKLSN